MTCSLGKVTLEQITRLNAKFYKIFKKLGVVLTCEPVSKKQKPLIG